MNKIFVVLAAGLLAACAGDGPGTAETPDGTKIDLSSSPLGLITADTTDGTLTGYNQNHSFYGIWENTGKTRYELKIQGTGTEDVPQSGRATYHGNAMRWDDVLGEIVPGGTSELNVDFGNKTVDGKITMPGLRRDVTLHQGNLRGSEYSGRASAIGNSNGSYEGKLFGKNAKETAGIVEFPEGSGLNGTFGGIRY